jgi:hypothetical protein
MFELYWNAFHSGLPQYMERNMAESERSSEMFCGTGSFAVNVWKKSAYITFQKYENRPWNLYSKGALNLFMPPLYCEQETSCNSRLHHSDDMVIAGGRSALPKATTKGVLLLSPNGFLHWPSCKFCIIQCVLSRKPKIFFSRLCLSRIY